MSANKLIFYLAIVVVSVIVTQVSTSPRAGYYAANNTNKSHNLIIGSRLAGDRLVLKDSVIKQSSWMSIVTVQKNYTVAQWQRITQIRALDQKVNGNGAFAKLVKGGPGSSNATMLFTSQRGHGINFVVEIYAR